MSITKLVDIIHELEYKGTLCHSDQLMVQRLQQRLVTVDVEFKRYHISVIDLVEEEKELEKEQSILDDHDERVVVMSDRLERLASKAIGTVQAAQAMAWEVFATCHFKSIACAVSSLVIV